MHPMSNRREFLWRAGGGLGGIALAHMLGPASQVDTFDYKPKLDENHGKKFDPGGKVELFQSFPGMCLKNPWGWQQFGKCGKHVSKLLPNIGSCVDDIAFVHSMVTT